jgi:hypothetical protein
LYGFFLFRGRLDLPQEIDLVQLVKENPGQVSLDDYGVVHPKDVDFILAQKRRRRENSVHLRLGQEKLQEIQLIPFYSRIPYPTGYLLIGLLCVGVGFGVFCLRFKEKELACFIGGGWPSPPLFLEVVSPLDFILKAGEKASTILSSFSLL